MRPRNLALLFLVVAALGAFIWFVESDLPSTDEKEEQAKKVLAFDEGDVVAVSIEAAGVSLRLEKEAEEAEEDLTDGEEKPLEWHLVAPLSARADRYAVERLLTSLTGLEKKRTLEEIDRATYGLEPPEIQVVLSTEEGETALLVGSELPASGNRVVTTGDTKEGYVVSGLPVEEMVQEAGQWRTRDLFHEERGQIERLRLATEGQELLLAKRGETFWVEAPFVDRADEDAVNELLAALTGLRAEVFLDEPDLDLQELGLEAPHGLVEVVLSESAEPLEIRWGGPVPEASERVYARVGEQIVETGGTLGELLGQSPQQWRCRQWTALRAYDLERAKLEAPGQDPLELHKAEADWYRGEEKLSYAPVSDLFFAVTGAEGEAVLPLHEVELTGVELVLQVTFEDYQERLEELKLYRDSEGLLLGTMSGREVVLELPAELEADLLEKLLAVRAAEPLGEEVEVDGQE